MARTRRSRRSYSAGEWGRNRVFPDPKTGLIQIEWREGGLKLPRLRPPGQLQLISFLSYCSPEATSSCAGH